MLGDGAYDTLAAYRKTLDKGIELVALPRDNAALDPKSTGEHVCMRNEHVKTKRMGYMLGPKRMIIGHVIGPKLL